MKRVVAALVVASTGAILAGCGGSGSTAGSTTSSSAAGGASAVAAATPVATTSTASVSPAGGRGTGASSPVSQPGATFAAGQGATVPYQVTLSNGADGPSFKLRIAVESIQRGTLADFNGIQLDADQKASTPYYVRVRMTNLAPGALNTSDNDPAGAVQGVDKTGQPQDAVTFLLGTFPRCPDANTPNPLKPGQSFDTCLTFLVPGGITKVAYTGPPQSYYDSPVTWAVN